MNIKKQDIQNLIVDNNFLNNQNYTRKKGLEINPLEIGKYLIIDLKTYKEKPPVNSLLNIFLFMYIITLIFLIISYSILSSKIISLIIAFLVLVFPFFFIAFFYLFKIKNNYKIRYFYISPIGNKYVFIDSIFYKEIVNKNEI